MADTLKSSRSGGFGVQSHADAAMESAPPIVFVLDDDPGVREALSSLLSSAGLHVRAFASAAEFQKANLANSASCLVLDLQLPDINGLDLQRGLAANQGSGEDTAE